MAKDDTAPKKPRIRKAPVTYREAAEKQRAKKLNKQGKTPRHRKAAKAAAVPFVWSGKAVAKTVRPLAFLLKPFRTKPLRFIGRVLGRIFWPKWLRNSISEVRQVVWPSRRETWKLTFAVFIFAIAFGLVISLVDYGLDKVFKRIILR